MLNNRPNSELHKKMNKRIKEDRRENSKCSLYCHLLKKVRYFTYFNN